MIAIPKFLPKKFIAFSSTLLIAIFIIENVNHHFWLNDFKVYYSAAIAMLNGKPVYGQVFALEIGYYKYSPFTAFLFFPFTLFPFKVAAIIQFFILFFSIVFLFILAWSMINRYFFNDQLKNSNLLLSLAFICLLNHLFREIHLGNINILLLLLLCLSLLCLLRNKFILAGALLAVVVITKPFFVLLFFPVLLRKHFKTIISFAIFMVLFIILPSLLTGITRNLELHQEWIQTMLRHNSDYPSNNTLDSLIKIYIYPGGSNLLQLYVILGVVTCYLILFFINRGREKKNGASKMLIDSGFILEWFVLIAIMPQLFKTDTQHFLLTFPLILLLICYLSTIKNTWMTIGFITVIFFYGLNISGIIGKTFSTRLDDLGALGISNLLILSWVIFIHFKEIKKRNFILPSL